MKIDLIIWVLIGVLAGAGVSMAGKPLRENEVRTPGEIRAEGNRLKGEGSAYLRQHAHNPVDWYPWGDEALARARAEDRPIFLSIGYASCHWCHVMESEVFEDDEVAALLNARFVCVKVDREERPDLDATYMEAVQAMTGRGGWPMSVFLTPDLQPFFGGTYFPRDEFLELCDRIARAFAERRGDLAEQAARVAAHVAGRPATGGDAVPSLQAARDAATAALAGYDAEWGGFLQAQKFPTPLRWRFLLHHYRRTGDAEVAEAIRHTLEAMAGGGLRDQLGGGFHRYTVERTWLVPHFEIMLYDDAQLASLYLEAGAVFDDDRYRSVAADVLDFLLRDMSDPAGGFYASFDADSGGEEGSYYVWTPAEIDAVAGPEDGPVLARLLGMTPAGNFEGRTILTRRASAAEVAREFGRDEAEVASLFTTWREALRERRARRTPPRLDRKLVTAWNGLAISALARGGAVLGEPRYLEAARRTADRLWDLHRDVAGRLHRASTDGVPVGTGILDDYAMFAEGLLDLYEAGGDPIHLRRAQELSALALELFSDESGAFFLTAADAEAPLGRRVDPFDSVEPSGASVMLHVLLREAALTGDPVGHERVGGMLARHADLLAKAGLEMAGWWDALSLWHGPQYDVVIAGGVETEALREAYWRLDPAFAVLSSVPAEGAGEEFVALLPSLAGKTASEGPVAYVCRFGACGKPATDPADLVAQLRADWKF